MKPGKKTLLPFLVYFDFISLAFVPSTCVSTFSLLRLNSSQYRWKYVKASGCVFCSALLIPIICSSHWWIYYGAKGAVAPGPPFSEMTLGAPIFISRAFIWRKREKAATINFIKVKHIQFGIIRSHFFPIVSGL